jgi:TetR/AcrR family fatty acid metabolism transcriptional regulator
MVIQRKRSRRERKHVVLRARIIATAIELFSRHGLDHITVEKIADVADIGKGTIYNYFRTKEDIVVAYMAGIESLLQARIPDFAASRKPLESVLIDFLRFHFRLKKPYHRFVRIFLAQMFSRTEQFLPYMLEMQKSIDPPLRALFMRLQESGRIRNDLDIRDLIVVFKTIQMGLTALWAIEGPPFRGTEKILKQEIRLFCEGLGART